MLADGENAFKANVHTRYALTGCLNVGPFGAVLRKGQEMAAAAFVFPGQGSQAVGMGKALAEAFPQARMVFDEVDAALSEKLTAIMWDGPADTLTLTENAQPALMAVSLAAMRVLEAEAGVASRAMRLSSPGIHSASTRHWQRRPR
jgi:acyl transferase domain-containing protein